MDYEVVGELLKIPLLDIYVDIEFNCRGMFQLLSVHDLGRSIQDKGLLEALVIQPICDTPDYQRPNPCPWKFRLVAGHRRYMAIDQLTDLDTATCRIMSGLSAEDAHTFNFTENLEREDLNMMQEAIAIERTWPGLSATEIKRKIKRDERWIRVRQKLVRLPEDIQTAAAIGSISQYDVESLSKLDKDEILPAFHRIRSSKGRVGQTAATPRRQHWRNNRSRPKKELGEMVTFLYMQQVYTSLTDRELKLVNSALAWASRGIDTQEFLVSRLDIPEECVSIDVDDRGIDLKVE